MIELLALKLKEVSKKASNIDEKIDNLAISQEKELNDKANAILKDFEVKYENYVKNIALPKDGKDFDLNLWENFKKDRDSIINKTVSELNDLKAEVIKFFQEQTANYNAIIKENESQNNKKEANYNAFIKEKESRIDEIILNIESFKGKDGKDGKDGIDGTNGKDGAKGKDGKNGIGIKDITEKNGEIVITLTDGTIKKLKMPRDIRVVTGGGGAKGGIDYAQLKSIEEPLLNNDEFMIFRDGKPYKVSLQSLSNYLGNDLPATAYTGTDGQGFTDLENNYYTSL
jgi:hypothetical protein